MTRSSHPHASNFGSLPLAELAPDQLKAVTGGTAETGACAAGAILGAAAGSFGGPLGAGVGAFGGCLTGILVQGLVDGATQPR